MAFLYRSANPFANPGCPPLLLPWRNEAAVGCTTGNCCQCRPDVFAYEQEVLELLPQTVDHTGYCPFFNLARRHCGITASGRSPCRIFTISPPPLITAKTGRKRRCMYDNLKPHLEDPGALPGRIRQVTDYEHGIPTTGTTIPRCSMRLRTSCRIQFCRHWHHCGRLTRFPEHASETAVSRQYPLE